MRTLIQNLFKSIFGDNEKICNSDLEQDDKEEDSPKDSLSYKEAISKLRSRLGPSICPLPEAKNTKVGASALDFFQKSRSDQRNIVSTSTIKLCFCFFD